MVVSEIVFIVLSWLIAAKATAAGENRQSAASFPSDFEFGCATSSYQIEGAWDIDGKGLSMWDHFVHTRPELIYNRSNGDIAANSYYHYKRDVEMLKELGVNTYRFSISWPRVMPNGRPDYVNPLGIAYYNALIDELLANGITPYVTMYHWDLPQNLNEQDGWLTEDIVDWFGDYARLLYQHFGDRVKHWMTINEAHIHCYQGYGYAFHPPLMKSPGVGYYECGRNILLAHARAYHIYDNEFRASQGGQVGFVISMKWGFALNEGDAQAARDFEAFYLEHYLQPVYSKEGNYPQIVIDRVAAASAKEGLNSSRLRPFTEEQIQYIRGTGDFLGLIHYVSVIVYRNSSVNQLHVIPSVDNDLNVATYSDESWPYHRFITEYPPGMYSLLIYLRDKYSHVPIYIVENGCSSRYGLDDDGRVGYFRGYLNSVLQAVLEGVNVKGYFAWSLMDNFEWGFGYDIRYGLYQIDMNDPNRTRVPKKSALVYKEIIRSRVIDYSYNPDPNEDGGQTDGALCVNSSILVLVMIAVINIVI